MRYNKPTMSTPSRGRSAALPRMMGHRSVLVFDRDAERRALILTYLDQVGLPTVVAHSGYEALRMVRESAPALMICTVAAGGDLGGRFFSILAKLQPGIRIILLMEDEGEGPRVRNRCVAGVLRGAFSSDDLYDLLQRALPFAEPQRA